MDRVLTRIIVVLESLGVRVSGFSSHSNTYIARVLFDGVLS